MPRHPILTGRPHAIVLALALLAASPIATAADPNAGLEITSCTVYSERDDNLVHDCAAEAKRQCPGPGTCELPIGLNLTGGKDIDGNPETWELVKVAFSCKGIAHLNGPHYQNDHATMTLACQK